VILIKLIFYKTWAIIATLLLPVALCTTTAMAALYGDVNGDGRVDIKDILCVRDAIFGGGDNTREFDQIIQIRIEKIEDGVESIWTESFDVPIFSGGTNEENVKKLNEKVQSMIASRRINGEYSEDGGYYVSEGTVRILEDGNEFKTVCFSWYWHMNSPHPYIDRDYLTFDAYSGEILPIDHFVSHIPDYKNRIDDYLMKKYKQERAESEDLEYYKKNVPLKWDGTDNYYYDKDNNTITIEYGDYALSIWAEHFTSITIRLAFLQQDVKDKIEGIWYLDENCYDEGSIEKKYMDYLHESKWKESCLRFKDGVFYSGYYEWFGEAGGRYIWHAEGTYATAGASTIRLFLNNENNDSVLFWRNGQEEVAYLNSDTETLRYVTDWSATDKRTINLIFR